MAKAQFIGVGGVARKVKAQHIGVAGVARKVKAGYIGVGGVARQFFSAFNGLILYDVASGGDNTAVTGGWYMVKSNRYINVYEDQWGFEFDIVSDNDEPYAGLITKNKVNISEYSKICVDGVRGDESIRVNIALSLSNTHTFNPAYEGIGTNFPSEFSFGDTQYSDYYVQIRFDNFNFNTNDMFCVNKIWLE